MDNYINSGDVLDVAAPYAVVSAAPLMLGSMVGICGNSAAAGEKVALHLVGSYSVVKAAGETWAVGEVVYWDNDLKNFTTTNVSGGHQAGVAIEAALSAAVVGKIRLGGNVG